MGIVNEMRLDFPAIPENESFARMVISAFMVPLNPTIEEMADVKTAVSEAVTNAIVHGYAHSQGTVRLCDELDHRAATLLRPELDALLKDPTIRRLVLDLKKLKFMDSSGIGLIIGRYKLLKRRGGSVAVMNADARVDRIFQMSGLYQIVERMA